MRTPTPSIAAEADETMLCDHHRRFRSRMTRSASSMTSLFISVVAASMRSPSPPDFASSRFALPLARRVPLLDACVRIVGKKKPQHEQQIGNRLERFKLTKTAQIGDDHLSHGHRAAFQVQQITRKQRAMFSGWGNAQDHFVGSETRKSSALCRRNHQGKFSLWCLRSAFVEKRRGSHLARYVLREFANRVIKCNKLLRHVTRQFKKSKSRSWPFNFCPLRVRLTLCLTERKRSPSTAKAFFSRAKRAPSPYCGAASLMDED